MLRPCYQPVAVWVPRPIGRPHRPDPTSDREVRHAWQPLAETIVDYRSTRTQRNEVGDSSAFTRGGRVTDPPSRRPAAAPSPPRPKRQRRAGGCLDDRAEAWRALWDHARVLTKLNIAECDREFLCKHIKFRLAHHDLSELLSARVIGATVFGRLSSGRWSPSRPVLTARTRSTGRAGRDVLGRRTRLGRGVHERVPGRRQDRRQARRVGGTAAPPTVTRVSPSHGSASGGKEIAITGTGCLLGATVAIGQGHGPTDDAIPATDVKVISSTQITATTGPEPSMRRGTFNLYVTDAGGASPKSRTDRFT
jgi:hypothetical protein